MKKRSAKGPTCYMCTAPATGLEHVPPRCLFPRQEDAPDGIRVRDQLITVPACDKHNASKSKDDEYLMVVLASSFETNELARVQFKKRSHRALMRRGSSLFKRIFSRVTPVALEGKPTVAFELDVPRFERAMGMVTRGLYYHHTGGEKLDAHLVVHSSSVVDFEPTGQARLNDIRRAAAEAFATAPRYGANPEVFFYQMVAHSTNGATLLRMVFYQGSEVLVTWGGAVEALPATD